MGPRPPHFEPRVKRVIWLFMHGGPSHVDLFDPKPDLIKYAGQPLPESFGMVMTRRKVAENPLLGADQAASARAANRAWRSATSCREIAEHADELCVIRSLPRRQRESSAVGLSDEHRQHPDGPAQRGQLGRLRPGEREPRPAGVRRPARSGRRPEGRPARLGQRLSARDLSGRHDAARRRSRSCTCARSRRISRRPAAGARSTWSLELNRRHLAARDNDDELAARIKAYELAFRMQSAAPDLVDLQGRIGRDARALRPRPEGDPRVRPALPARPADDRARRAVRAGLFGRHQRLGRPQRRARQPHQATAARTDKPVAGLLTDLKRRGLWNDTLVIWGGEFGRMPMSEQGKGRDHNPWGYTVWLAGGGVKAGIAYGATDPVGLRAAENKVHIRDFHATLLHLLGLDHERPHLLPQRPRRTADRPDGRRAGGAGDFGVELPIPARGALSLCS